MVTAESTAAMGSLGGQGWGWCQDWSMEEHSAAWVPCNLQLANWTMEPAECSPGLPAVEYASAEIFCNSIQTSVPVFKGEQLVEYGLATMYGSVATAEHQYVVDLQDMEKIIHNPIHCFKEASDEFRIDMDMIGKKIHRYPASIQSLCLSERYTVPMVVAIGPYHHGRDPLKKTEIVKHVAAYNCIRISRRSVQEMYVAVVAKAHDVRRLYDKDVVEDITDKDLLPMMFYDACFLVLYMLSMSEPEAEIDDSLCKFFDANDNEIYHDIMLLENQLPWPIVQTVMEFVPVPLDKFTDSLKGCLQDRKESVQETCVSDYEPPHLLALLRFYIVGGKKTGPDRRPEWNSISFSVSAIELAEIGITVKPSAKTELIHMGVKTKGTLFAELFLASLSLDSARASWLINMAALELCTTPNFRDAKDEESAVCSYLLLLAMMADREEDAARTGSLYRSLEERLEEHFYSRP
ncbi:hypothetical protein EJB05_23075, partial [Eragrostis curvula]